MKKLNTIFWTLILGFLFSCSSQTEESRFHPSGINSSFTFDTNKPFSKYVEESKQMIAKARVDLNKRRKLFDSKDIIELNAPFILLPDAEQCSNKKKRKILLVHGLTDSAFSMRDLGEKFNNQCFTVYSLLLTGHGTRPGDLLEVSYTDWIKQVDYAVKELSKVEGDLYLAGFSIGSALLTNYVISNPEEHVNGLILLSPAYTLTNQFNALLRTNIAQLALKTVDKFKPWLEKLDDDNYFKYESLSSNAGLQTVLLLGELQEKFLNPSINLKHVKTFSAMTYEDQTIDPGSTLNLILKQTSPSNRHVILYHQNRLPGFLVHEKNLFAIESTIPNQNILDFAHVSTVVSSDNFWYGENGLYRDCVIYFSEPELYKKCKNSNDVFFGETTEENLEKGIVVRLTHNPLLTKLFDDLRAFYGLY